MLTSRYLPADSSPLTDLLLIMGNMMALPQISHHLCNDRFFPLQCVSNKADSFMDIYPYYFGIGRDYIGDTFYARHPPGTSPAS